MQKRIYPRASKKTKRSQKKLQAAGVDPTATQVLLPLAEHVLERSFHGEATFTPQHLWKELSSIAGRSCEAFSLGRLQHVRGISGWG